MNAFRSFASTLLIGLATVGPMQAQQQPPMTEADAVLMLVSDDYRQRDQAMYFVLHRAQAGVEIGAELLDALLRATESPDWGKGRPRETATPDGWGEVWIDYRYALASLRHPATIPILLETGQPFAAYALGDIGQAALAPTLLALEDPSASESSVGSALKALTIMVYEALPTEEEEERIAAAVKHRLTGEPLPLYDVTAAIALAVTLGTPELVAMVERVAEDRTAAEALARFDDHVDTIQSDAREALQPGFVAAAVRFRGRRTPPR